MSRIDKMIAGDLAALGENSRRDVPALDDALRTNDAYRDDRPGAEARRNALADERRRELVLMPLTLAHVFAHRMGRIAAGSMALAIASVLFVMLGDSLLLRFASWLVPGLNVGMLILMAALAIISSYVVASWIAEAWFARRMRAAIKTGDDAYRDLDQLARGPLEIAHAAVQKLDGWSTGLFLAGFTSITLVFGYIVVVVGMHHTISHAWSINGILETGALQRNLGTIGFVVIAAIGASYAVGRACKRDAIVTSTIAKALSSWMALAIAAIIALVTAYNGLHVLFRFDTGHRLPSEQVRYVLALGCAITVFVPLAWALLFWRRREHARTNI